MRGPRWIAVFAIVAGLLPTTRAASSPGCQVATTWKYCGQHWRAPSLPAGFRLNTAGAPAGMSATDVRAAVAGAMQTWNLAWPHLRGETSLSPVLGYAGSTSSGFGHDGQNTILFGDPSVCGDGDAAAVTCVWFQGSSGTAASRIAEVDIVIDPTRVWKIASPVGLLTGETAGLTPYVAACARWWWDLQSSLTHEFGHALGLKHIGDTTRWFPAGNDPLDALRFTETMYAWDYPCTTNKRTLDSGDLIGLQQVALETFSD